MKFAILKTGILLFFYTLIVSLHLQNSYYYYISYVKNGDFYNSTKMTKELADILHIPVGKYLTKDEYVIIQGFQNVANNTKIVLRPFESSVNLLVSLALLISITLIVYCLDFKAYFKSGTILGVIFLFFFIQPIYVAVKAEPETQNFAFFERKIQILENDYEDRISDLEERIDEIEYNEDY